jgi:hypothetical protein
VSSRSTGALRRTSAVGSASGISSSRTGSPTLRSRRFRRRIVCSTSAAGPARCCAGSLLVCPTRSSRASTPLRGCLPRPGSDWTMSGSSRRPPSASRSRMSPSTWSSAPCPSTTGRTRRSASPNAPASFASAAVSCSPTSSRHGCYRRGEPLVEYLLSSRAPASADQPGGVSTTSGRSRSSRPLWPRRRPRMLRWHPVVIE